MTRVQTIVDRRFNRSRYDAERVMSVFVASLQEKTSAEEVASGWTGVVTATLAPSAIGILVRTI